MSEQKVAELVQVFNDCFQTTENTVLETGGEEPIYLPDGGPNGEARIVSTRDYFASALHEISHWCIAGKERRKKVDYGYWYEPDGRSAQQQIEFERVEIMPQALEWIFSEACGHRFRISADNLNQPELVASDTFKQNVARQAQIYAKRGVAGRSARFLEALLRHYYPEGKQLVAADFCPTKL